MTETTTPAEAETEAAKAAAVTPPVEAAAKPERPAEKAPSKPKAHKPGHVLKKGAAPKPDEAPGDPDTLVSARITKNGHGEVFDGAGGFYDWNDEVVLPNSVALDLEKRAYAEIVAD